MTATQKNAQTAGNPFPCTLPTSPQLAMRSVSIAADAGAWSVSRSPNPGGTRPRSSRRNVPMAMAAGLDNDKRLLQVGFRVAFKNRPQFPMHRFNCRRRHSQVHNARTAALHENEAAEVPIAGHKDSPLGLCTIQQLRVGGGRQSCDRGRHNIVPQLGQETSRDGVNVLVQEDPHAGTRLTWTSSTATISMAY